MSSSRAAARLLVAVLLLAGAVGGQEEPARFLSPPPDVPAFGLVDLEVVGWPAETERVDFVLDGRVVAQDDTPPFRARVDAGQENRAKTFEAVFHAAAVELGRVAVRTPAIRVDESLDLRLQQLYVTATQGEAPVLDLRRSDFSVADRGTPQDIVTFHRGDVPLRVVLALDASRSMAGDRFDIAVASAERFVSKLADQDEVQLLVFSDSVQPLADAAAPGAATTALRSVQPSGGTALNDALYQALRALDQRSGRPVVIVFSDGADTVSWLRAEDVGWKALRSDAVIYSVQGGGSLGRRVPLATAWRSPTRSATEVIDLEQVIRGSGGRIVEIGALEELEGALDSILTELRQQYVLGYYPSGPREPGSWRPVRVRAARAGVRLRTRSGYIEP